MVARLMRQEGVQVWSLTDHDTTSGWLEAQRAANVEGLVFVPGVEITCEPAQKPEKEQLLATGRERASASWHLLAFFPNHRPGAADPKIEAFNAWLLLAKTVANLACAHVPAIKRPRHAGGCGGCYWASKRFSWPSTSRPGHG